ncbi:PilZ domain-containing protein [Sphingobium sufflavum]|uniref:PilZ domain-containing protein n=1 Tax=Sphingobium sufflavum TaxID=1129547 RepID=UPI002DD421AB|nr:PilZ domain-containing protein [Sphingobium sufflavum]
MLWNHIIAMSHEIDPASPAARRTAQRDSLLLLTEFLDEEGESIASVRVRNLSATGLMAECDRLLVEGSRVRLTLRGTGEIGASVSWCRDGRVGLAFDEHIDPMVVRRPVGAGAPRATPTLPVTRFSRTVR